MRTDVEGKGMDSGYRKETKRLRMSGGELSLWQTRARDENLCYERSPAF